MKHRTLLLAAVTFLLAGLPYLPTLDDPPLNWDDPEYIQLPLLREPDALIQIWTSFATPQVYPVLFTSLWLDRALWGESIPATRATNLILHGVVAMCAFYFLREALRRGPLTSVRTPSGEANREHVPPSMDEAQLPADPASTIDWVAFFGALLFALHPTQVATVAWIAERKNLLAAIFLLLSLLAYRGARRASAGGRFGVWRWTLAYLFGLLAMLSKSTAVVLPLLVVWIELWIPASRQTLENVARGSVRPREHMRSQPAAPPETARGAPRRNWSDWKRISLRTLPFFGFALLQSGLTLFREHGPAITTDTSWIERIAISARALWFYLGKLIWPSNLSPMYPRWPLDGAMLLWGAIAIAGLALVIAVLFHAARRRESSRPSPDGDAWIASLIFGFGFFAIASLPTIGLIPFGYMEKSFVADHFLYLPALGFWIAVCASLQHVTQSRQETKRRAFTVSVAAIGSACILLYGGMTVSRLQHWKNSEAFWSRAIATTPGAWVAWGNRGEYRAREGRWADARSDLESALEIRPDYPEARFNLGYVLDRQGDLAGARAQYERAVALSPNFAEAHLNLGIVLARQGDRTGTRREIEAARALDPRIPVPPSIDTWLYGTGK